MVKDILSGNYDGELDNIARAIKTRREQLNVISFFEFKVGDTVKFNSTTRPQYLIGHKAIIREKKQKKIVVDLLAPIPGSRFYRGIVTAVSLIEKV